MLYHVLKVSFRNLTHLKSYTFLNMLGLSLGMASVLFIALFVINEIDYDRYFDHGDCIYRIGITGNIAGKHLDGAVSPAPLAARCCMKFRKSDKQYDYCPIMDWSRPAEVHGLKDLFLRDASFFQLFNLKFIAGNPDSALYKPYCALISEEMALKIFGDRNPIGRTLHFESDSNEYEIKAVVSVPKNIHFHFDCLASMSSLLVPLTNRDGWLIACIPMCLLIKSIPSANCKTICNAKS